MGTADPEVCDDPQYCHVSMGCSSRSGNSFLDAAVGYDFVMSSILAFSATHLGWMTNSVETKNLAYYHRGVALKGLHGAIGKFSKENSDPVLAASILLSWQAADW